MTPSGENELVDSLKRIDDDDADGLVSEQAFFELAQAILAVAPVPVARRRGGRSRQPGALRRPAFVLAMATTVAAIALAATGVFSGSGPAEVQLADAAILHGALRAPAHPGTIVIEAYCGISRVRPRSAATTPGDTRFSVREIIDTPAGHGAQNYPDLSGIADIDLSGVQSGEIDGNNELYDPGRDTIYVSSRFGSDIRKARRPGSDNDTLTSRPSRPGASAPPPLTITAAQAAALRDGRADVLGPLPDSGHPSATHLRIVPLVDAPVQTARSVRSSRPASSGCRA